MNKTTKQKMTLILSGILLLFLPACKEKADPGINPLQDKPWEISRQSLVRVLEGSHFTPEQFVDTLGAPSFKWLLEAIAPEIAPWADALIKAKVLSHVPSLDKEFREECGVGLISKPCWEIQSYTFTYRSQTVDGRDVELSGRVTFPNNLKEDIPHQVKSLSLHAHQGLIDPDWTPSRNLMFMPLKALWDSAVIEPDFQKWGVTYGIEPDGSGSSVHMARQLTDCIVAALEVMRQQGVTLSPNGYSTNWGSSQGGATSLWFAKWYENDAPQWFKDALRMKSTFSAEGPVDTQGYWEYTYKHPELIPSNITILTGYFEAFSQAQLGGYLPGDFVPRWFSDDQFEWDGRKVSFLDALSHYFPDILSPYSVEMTSFDQICAPDMLTADGKVDMNCPKMRTWLSCHRKYNSLEGWNPVLPVYLASSREDQMVPFELAYSLYRTISNQGRNASVHMLSIPSFGDVPTGGLDPHFIISTLVQIEMACVEDPEDMLQLYQTVE